MSDSTYKYMAQMRYYYRNREKIIERQKEYYQKNKDRHLKYILEYFFKNKDKCQKQNKDYYHKNNYKLYHREYYRKNKDRINKNKNIRIEPHKDHKKNKEIQDVKNDMKRKISCELDIFEDEMLFS